MPKHRLSPAPLPVAKRAHTDTPGISTLIGNFDSILYDELVLVIFSYLSWTDLCAVQQTNRHWARLSTDNQLWKDLFIREYGRSRLRGSRGHYAFRKHQDRQFKPLPGRTKEDEHIDWKWMFRISSNWRKGRCGVQTLSHGLPDEECTSTLPSCIALVGSLVATTSPCWSLSPPVVLHGQHSERVSLFGNIRTRTSTYITNLTLDQSPPSSLGRNTSRLVAFYETGDFSMFLVDPDTPSSSRRALTYHAVAKTDRTSPIVQAAYHHPLLVTLSSAFNLSLYSMAGDEVVHTHTVTSFTSYPPSSLVLSAPSSDKPYRLIVSYAIPVYPAHWSVAATELSISTHGTGGSTSFTVLRTRTARTIDIPSGWIDENKLQEIREQWNRKVGRVADTQTDGKWVVLAPSSSTASHEALQLYRLHFSKQHTPYSGDSSLDAAIQSATSRNRLTFVRSLYGPTMPVQSLALADGRCISLGAGGEIWVWDLEHGWGVEVQRSIIDASTLQCKGSSLLNETPGAVAFDERRIVSTGTDSISLRRFDM